MKRLSLKGLRRKTAASASLEGCHFLMTRVLGFTGKLGSNKNIFFCKLSFAKANTETLSDLPVYFPDFQVVDGNSQEDIEFISKLDV